MSRFPLILSLLAGLCLWSTPALAAGPSLAPELLRNPAYLKTMRAYEVADKQMVSAYQRLSAQLNAPNRKKLETIQSAWEKYRDLQADLESSRNLDASAIPFVNVEILTELTKARTDQLEAMVF